MHTPFSLSGFLDILEILARTPGPSLGEEPRRNKLLEILSGWGLASKVDTAGNLWIPVQEGDFRDALVLDAHMDVVADGVAHTLTRTETHMIGRGVADNLAAVSMLCLAARSLTNRPLRRPLYIVLSTGEEGHGNLAGMRQMLEDHPVPPHLFLALDLAFDEWSTAALGSVRFRFTAKGSGGHSWDDRKTPSAIMPVLNYLAALTAHVNPDAFSNPTSFNIGSVAGGEGINMIAANASAAFEFRSTSETVLNTLSRTATDILSRMPRTEDMETGLTLTGIRPAAAPTLSPEQRNAMASCFAATGISPVETARSTNINLPMSQGWPAACIGICRCGNIHREDEFLEISSIETGWKLLQNILDSFAL